MVLRPALFVLALGVAPVTAQDVTWDPDSWTEDGWTVEGLDDLPSGEEMLQNQLNGTAPGTGADRARPRGRPLDTVEREDPLQMYSTESAPRAEPVVVTEMAGGGAVLRGLDKVSGTTADLALGPGGRATFGRLEVILQECRYPADNPASDAFAFVEIAEPGAAGRLFSGWMLASSPALNPLDHARYDIWVLRCNNA
ncbi:hypothetical protein SAMN05444722_0473 [Rhodovulum sp. ES.010]|uniref:DUF2155 domain-containing protein n=1 Tax=Rhodovulum sp. ES.010 TaxID=1882821 RepID=UPI00092CDDF5|nr:DUF2155 domain-containing protein [Rhodovulum sp. ES.010]SIO11488.1 hypothetical protein SAMN05444722_0473 [Rhodovulum sp. ES.010]